MIRKWVVTLVASSTLLGLGLTAVANQAVAADEPEISKTMGGIDIAPGERVGDLSTVNGGIHIGSNGSAGHVRSVNGGIHLDSGASTGDLETKNGGVHVKGGRVTGSIHAVNGGLKIEDQADVSGAVANVNGGIHVVNAHIHGSVHAGNGGLDLGPDARIDGDVSVARDDSTHVGEYCPQKVVVEPGTVVKGKLTFERPVKLYVSDQAKIGPVEGAQAILFSGDHPPETDDCAHHHNISISPGPG